VPESASFRRCGIRVTLRADTETVRYLRARVRPFIEIEGANEQSRDSWVLVGGIEHAPAELAVASDICRVAEPSPGEADRRLVISRHARVLVVDHEPGLWRKLYCLRALRNLMRRGLESRGHVYLHAGGVAFGGRCALFLGGKRTGKSSSILALLNSAPPGMVAFVGNDDVSVAPAGDKVVALGWPRSVSLRRETLVALGLDVTFAQAHLNRHPSMRTASEVRRQDAAYFYPLDVARAMNVEVATKVPVAMLVFPTFLGVEDARASLTPIRPRARLARLETTVEPMADPRYTAFLNGAFETDLATQQRLLARLAALPAFELRQSMRTLKHAARLVLRELAGAEP
jgi:hypothetical protein